jgi:hypothetical protein
LLPSQSIKYNRIGLLRQGRLDFTSRGVNNFSLPLAALSMILAHLPNSISSKCTFLYSSFGFSAIPNLDQTIGIGTFGPLALGVFRLEPFIGFLKLFWIMAALVPGDSLKEDVLWRGMTL